MTLPTNLSPLSPNGFNFTIAKLPDVTFFCQDVVLPGITLGEPTFSTPFVTTPVPGDHLTYDVLRVRFLIDSSMSNYLTLYNWIVALGFPQTFSQYITLLNDDKTSYDELAKNYSDGTLHILDALNNPIRSVKFVDMFPVALETLSFSTTNTGVDYLTGEVTFRYSYYMIT